MCEKDTSGKQPQIDIIDCNTQDNVAISTLRTEERTKLSHNTAENSLSIPTKTCTNCCKERLEVQQKAVVSGTASPYWSQIMYIF